MQPDLAERATAGLHDHIFRCIVALIPNKASRVLDVGCGTGAMLSRLKESGYLNLIGADIDPPFHLPGVSLHRQDLDCPSLPLAEESIDLCVAIELIEHLESPGMLLAELRRVLRPGGIVLITTPNVHSIEARVRWMFVANLKQFDSKGDPTHITPIFRFPFRRLVERHGFIVTKEWGFLENGSSPSSRPSLRLLARFVRLLGLRGQPDGDVLCLALQKSQPEAGAANQDKQQILTAHYR